MIKNKKFRSLVVFFLVSAMLVNYFGFMSVFSSESDDICVTATTNVSVKQGNYGYCYVYIDSLETLSSLSVAVHYDPSKIKVQSDYVYNNVPCVLNDKSVGDSSVKFSYIFDGKGATNKTQLFYFRYQVLSNAEISDTYFDVVVSEAFDSSLQAVSVSGSRCSFKITETITTKTCNIYSFSEVSTSVGEEFELTYRISSAQIASGSFIISYDPDLFEVVSVTNGAFCEGKIVDVNTKLSGAVYVSFVGTEYESSTDLTSVRFKTLKNTSETSTIKIAVIEFLDLGLNTISCSGYTTTADIIFDETYTEDAPNMYLEAEYDDTIDKVILTVKLDKDSMLGAGDFVLNFDTNYLTYSSVEKGFSPTFFNINNKNVADGILKFSIISLADIMDEQTVLTVVFDVEHTCEDKAAGFEIDGSGLTDSLTKSILLNFIDTSVTIPLEHIKADADVENKVDATCTTVGSYESVVRCASCGGEISRETKVIDMLEHVYTDEEATTTYLKENATCTSKAVYYKNCATCDKAGTDTFEFGETEEHEWNEGEVTEEPTCTESGVKIYTCIDCRTTKEEDVEVLGHDWSDWEYTDTDVHTRYCKRGCGIDEESEGHSWSNWSSADESEHTRSCSICNGTHTLSHKWNEGEITAEPTHTTSGERTYTCLDCGSTKTEQIAKTTEHSHGAWSKVDEETHQRTCECGDVETEAHEWNEGEVTEEPTHTSEGVVTYKCIDCAATKEEPIAPVETPVPTPTPVIAPVTAPDEAERITSVLKDAENTTYSIMESGEYVLDIPAEYEKELTFVYKVDTESGTYKLVASNVTDGEISFTAENEGIYALVQVEVGDINLDLETNINDVLGLLKSVSNSAECTVLNDVDKNGSLNINDVLAELKNITSK